MTQWINAQFQQQLYQQYNQQYPDRQTSYAQDMLDYDLYLQRRASARGADIVAFAQLKAVAEYIGIHIF